MVNVQKMLVAGQVISSKK